MIALRFPFLNVSLDIKTLAIASLFWKLSFDALSCSSANFPVFPFLQGVFSFAIGNFSYYCVVLSTLHIKMLKVVTEVFLRKCRPASRKNLFLKICSEAGDVLGDSIPNGWDTACWERAGWENASGSRNQSDRRICKRSPPAHVLRTKSSYWRAYSLFETVPGSLIRSV